MIPVIIEESPFSWGLISVIYNAIADINLQRYELKNPFSVEHDSKKWSVDDAFGAVASDVFFLKTQADWYLLYNLCTFVPLFFSHDGGVR